MAWSWIGKRKALLCRAARHEPSQASGVRPAGGPWDPLADAPRSVRCGTRCGGARLEQHALGPRWPAAPPRGHRTRGHAATVGRDPQCRSATVPGAGQAPQDGLAGWGRRQRGCQGDPQIIALAGLDTLWYLEWMSVACVTGHTAHHRQSPRAGGPTASGESRKSA